MKKQLIRVLALTAFPAAVSLAASPYTITMLPAPAGTATVWVRAVSPSGLVAGAVFIGDPDTYSGYYQPVIWQYAATVLLPLPNNLSGIVGAINDSGQASGGIWPGGLIPQPGFPSAWYNNQLQVLPTPAGTLGSTTNIDAQGNVLGSVESQTEMMADGIGHTAYAAMWSNGQLTQIGNFPGLQAAARARNSRGDILLSVSNGATVQAYVWSSGNLTQIESITGGSVAAYAMNDAGQVIGTARTGGDVSHAFLWQNSNFLDLGAAPDGKNSFAVAINSSGIIVGYEYDSSDDIYGLLWQNGQLLKLGDLIPADSGWSQLQPSGIADNGAIAGTGIYNGQTAAFLLTPSASPSGTTPTPEPATAATLALAATLLLLRRRSS